MPGYLLHAGATVTCAHGGVATPDAPNARVRVMGQPVVTQPSPYTIIGCPFTVPPGVSQPCVAATWAMAALRVKVMGQPVVLSGSLAICTPNLTPLMIGMTQTRVTGM
jgi:hypothetical protein